MFDVSFVHWCLSCKILYSTYSTWPSLFHTSSICAVFVEMRTGCSDTTQPKIKRVEINDRPAQNNLVHFTFSLLGHIHTKYGIRNWNSQLRFGCLIRLLDGISVSYFGASVRVYGIQVENCEVVKWMACLLLCYWKRCS